ncbi:hypothetical protein BKA80DRAFT_262779, partial [Phyllosticta citrichinensis]
MSCWMTERLLTAIGILVVGKARGFCCVALPTGPVFESLEVVQHAHSSAFPLEILQWRFMCGHSGWLAGWLCC